MAQILSSILSRLGFFSQIDKKELEKNFNELSMYVLNLKKDIASINQDIVGKQIESMQVLADMRKEFFLKLEENEEKNKEMKSQNRIWKEDMESLVKECLNRQCEEIKTIYKLYQDTLKNINTINKTINDIDKIKLTSLTSTIVDNHVALSEQTTKYVDVQKKQLEEMMTLLNKNFSQQSVEIAEINQYCENLLKNNTKIRDILVELNKNKMTKEDLDVISSFLRLLAANQLMQSASDICESQVEEH